MYSSGHRTHTYKPTIPGALIIGDNSCRQTAVPQAGHQYSIMLQSPCRPHAHQQKRRLPHRALRYHTVHGTIQYRRVYRTIPFRVAWRVGGTLCLQNVPCHIRIVQYPIMPHLHRAAFCGTAVSTSPSQCFNGPLFAGTPFLPSVELLCRRESKKRASLPYNTMSHYTIPCNPHHTAQCHTYHAILSIWNTMSQHIRPNTTPHHTIT